MDLITEERIFPVIPKYKPVGRKQNREMQAEYIKLAGRWQKTEAEYLQALVDNNHEYSEQLYQIYLEFYNEFCNRVRVLSKWFYPNKRYFVEMYKTQ